MFVTDDPRPDDHYQDGDIVCAFTDNRILSCHAQMLADYKRAPKNGDGLRVDGTERRVLEAVCQLKFERISATEVRRTNLVTLEQAIIGPTPNAAGEYIHLAEYLARRKQHPRHRIFGTEGAEYWYMDERWESANVSAAWDIIEADTPHRRTDSERTKWPLSHTERRHFLALPAAPMRDEVAARAVGIEIDFDRFQPEFNEEAGIGNQLVRKRRAYIAWRDLGLPVSDILNRNKIVDLRDVLQPAGPQLAQAKPRKNVWSVRGHLRPLDDQEFFIGGGSPA